MRLQEVLRRTPGLQKRFVYYLEAQGYIHPTKIPKLRIARRDYPEGDLRLIQEVWRYYQRGYGVQFAHELATRPERTVAYITLEAAGRRWREVVQVLRSLREVTEVSAVYGGSWNILLKTDTPEEADIYHALVPALAEAGIASMPTILKAREHYRNGEESMPQEGLFAYVLMKVPSKHIEGVAEALRAFPQVREISVIYGESDIIAKVHAASPQELDTLVMQEIHGLEPVESTRTFIVIGNLHWAR
jgi:DNA-binding Lrp family transcriptional regulator